MHRPLKAVGVAVLVAGLLAGCIRFGAPTTHTVPLAANETISLGGIVVGDVTGDGRSDVLAGIQTPSFSSRRTQVMISCGAGCSTVGESLAGWRPTAAADFDGDGIDDVVASSAPYYQGGSRLYFGGAAEGSRPAGLAQDDWIPLPDSWEYGIGDLDGDGDLDLVQTTTFFTYYLEHRFLRNDGTGTFADAGVVGNSGPLNAGGGGYLIVGDGTRDRVYSRFGGEYDSLPAGTVGAGDVDGDGIDDLVHWNSTDDEVTFSKGTGSGFTPFPDYQTIPITSLSAWRLGDLDGDGHSDLWLWDYYANTATILGGSGDGGFPYEPVGSVPLGYLSFGDLDGDGLPEAVGTTADSRGIVVHPNSSTT
ncbi:MAG: VCBS repeat-containing protein [Acidimicrobiales bacterium]